MKIDNNVKQRELCKEKVLFYSTVLIIVFFFSASSKVIKLTVAKISLSLLVQKSLKCNYQETACMILFRCLKPFATERDKLWKFFLQLNKPWGWSISNPVKTHQMKEQVTKYKNIKEAYKRFIATGRIRKTSKDWEHLKILAVIRSLMSFWF